MDNEEEIKAKWGDKAISVAGRNALLAVGLALGLFLLYLADIMQMRDNRSDLNVIMRTDEVIDKSQTMIIGNQERIIKLLSISNAQHRYENRLLRAICHGLVPRQEQLNCEPPEENP